MTKSIRNKMIAIIIVGIIVIAGIVTGVILIAPRKLVSVAGIGKLENVSSIVYKSSPCCGYHEGAEYEFTIDDDATIESVVAQFNSAKMKWSIPEMLAGGSNQQVLFRTATGDKTVKFSNGKIGNFKFTEKQNALEALLHEVSVPLMYIAKDYIVNINCDFLVVNSYAEYQNFVSTINNYNSNQDSINLQFFNRNKLIVVNLGEDSSSYRFYLTKITQIGKSEYLLKIEKKEAKDILKDDVITASVALLSVPKDLDTTKISFEIVKNNLLPS